MNINSIENAMLKIPSVTEVSIKTPPKIYEAFIYKWTNLITNKKYVGSHKGKVGDGYKDTSSNIEFKKDRASGKSKFKYEVLEYGDYEEIKNKERLILQKVDAAKSDEWYNKHNGSSGKQLYRSDKINELFHRIMTGDFEVQIESIDDVYQMDRLQIRDEALDTKHVRDIRDRLDDVAGNTDNCEPVLVYEKRNNGTDVVGNGNHTVEAVHQCKDAFQIPTMRIPKEVHSEYSNIELRAVSNMMNKKEKVVTKKAGWKDAVKHLISVYVNSGLEADDYVNMEWLSMMGYSMRQIRQTIIPNAQKAIEEKRLEAANLIFIKYDVNSPYHPQLLDTVDALKDSETFADKYSSSFIKLAEIQKKFRLAKKVKPKLKHIRIVVHHPDKIAADKWDSEVLLHQPEIDYWFLTHPDVESFEWVPMESEIENKLTS